MTLNARTPLTEVAVAVQIACANRMGMTRIRAWSIAEGATAGFEEFVAAVKAARQR